MNVPESLEARNELLAGYVLGDLSPEEMAAVEQQLRDDPELAAELSHLQTSMSWLAMDTPAVAPPPTLRDRLMAQVTPPVPAPPPAPQPATRGTVLPFRFGRRDWLTAAAAIALAVLGVSNFQMQQRLATVEQEFDNYQEAIALLRQPQNRLLSIQSVSDTTSTSGTGSLVIAPEQNAAILTLQNMESPPDGMVYRMWAYVDGEKVDCTDFMPDASGQVFLQFPLDGWEDTSSVVVNIEPEASEQPENGEMILTGESL